jgi:hypothetical protein
LRNNGEAMRKKPRGVVARLQKQVPAEYFVLTFTLPAQLPTPA